LSTLIKKGILAAKPPPGLGGVPFTSYAGIGYEKQSAGLGGGTIR
jgi:hypothetical protein